MDHDTGIQSGNALALWRFVFNATLSIAACHVAVFGGKMLGRTAWHFAMIIVLALQITQVFFEKQTAIKQIDK